MIVLFTIVILFIPVSAGISFIFEKLLSINTPENTEHGKLITEKDIYCYVEQDEYFYAEKNQPNSEYIYVTDYYDNCNNKDKNTFTFKRTELKRLLDEKPELIELSGIAFLIIFFIHITVNLFKITVLLFLFFLQIFRLNFRFKRYYYQLIGANKQNTIDKIMFNRLLHAYETNQKYKISSKNNYGFLKINSFSYMLNVVSFHKKPRKHDWRGDYTIIQVTDEKILNSYGIPYKAEKEMNLEELKPVIPLAKELYKLMKN